jgi:alpha-tubulin suppressor-like RCC1 family protein
MGDNLNVVDLGSGRTAMVIVAGDSHTCAILDNASVKCWGANATGQLGLGDTNNRGDVSGEMGDTLNSVDLGSGRTAKSIVAGGSHTCALLDDNSVKCWGKADDGQLGTGKEFTLGDASGEMGNTLLAIDLGTGRTATAIAVGGEHSCAILDNSSIKCWGKNSSGQLGLGHNDTRGGDQVLLSTGAPLMGDLLPSVDLGTGRTARAITAGDNQTCAILDNESIKCWGSNTAGQLGLGNTSNRGDNSSEMGDNLPVIGL